MLGILRPFRLFILTLTLLLLLADSQELVYSVVGEILLFEKVVVVVYGVGYGQSCKHGRISYG